jgi:enterochelin esterase family protein
MSDAPRQAWIQPQPNVPTGEIKPLKISSDILKKERAVSVYTPAGYATDKQPYGLLIVFDGWDYLRLIPLPTILDNLIASQKIMPLVAILIHNESQATRNRELGCDAIFTDFLAKELVPWARKNYRLSLNPKQTIVAGASLGGVSAAYCALRYPEVFGNVLSQSGAFWHYPGWPGKEAAVNETGWLARQFEAQRKLPIRFYLEAGLFETDLPLTILTENRRMRDVLKAKGYELTYSEFAGGHDYVYWRGSVADGLIALAGREKQH